MRALWLVVVMLLAGCVSLTPPQQQLVDDLQDFADRTARVYVMPRVRVWIQPGNTLNVGAVYRQGSVLVNVRMLDSRDLRLLMAHELGHYVLGHEPLSATTTAAWQRAQEQRELDANAKAVEILMRVDGLSQADAVRMFASMLRRSQAARDRGAPDPAGHLPPAAELADLLARYPTSADPTGSRDPSRPAHDTSRALDSTGRPDPLAR